jgi:SAM-dependent methyltransferase
MLGVSIALFAKTKKGRERIITALKRGINRIFYRTELGRKWFWNNSAIRINDEYGSLNHDFEILREIIRNGNVKHLLDIGCGSGRLFSLYRDMEIKEVVGQDCSNKALKLARRKFPDSQFKFTNTTITGLNFPPSYFDLIISNRVLQHIPPENIDGVVRTLCRLGKFIYANETTLADDKINSFNLFQHDYMNLFSKFGYEIKTSGIVFSETGKKQYWFLYEMTDAKE